MFECEPFAFLSTALVLLNNKAKNFNSITFVPIVYLMINLKTLKKPANTGFFGSRYIVATAFGGGEGSRTPVRKPVSTAFYKLIILCKIPLEHPQNAKNA